MLSDVKVAKIRYKGQRTPGKPKIEKHPDRDGLYLAVSPPHQSNPQAPCGSRAWRMDFRFPPTASGERFTLTFGRYPELSLAEARDKHLEARRAISNGINPAKQKQEQKRAMLTELEKTFETIAAKWLESEKKGKSTGWAENNERWLDTINLKIGKKPIAGISDEDVQDAVRPLEVSGHAYSASRALRLTAQIFEFARLAPWRFKGVNPAKIIQKIKVPKAKNHRHIDASEIPAFLKAVDGSNGAEQTKIAAKLLLLTFVRKQELLAAKRSELRLQDAIWEVPADRMKNRQPHLVPLAPQAVELFKRQLELAGSSEYVFPNKKAPGRHASKSTLNALFGRIGFKDRLTPHGLRSVASTKLNGTRKFGGEIIELQLSHKRQGVKGVYDKSTHLELRAEMMSWWAEYIDQLCEGKPEEKNVIQLRAVAA